MEDNHSGPLKSVSLYTLQKDVNMKLAMTKFVIVNLKAV